MDSLADAATLDAEQRREREGESTHEPLTASPAPDVSHSTHEEDVRLVYAACDKRDMQRFDFISRPAFSRILARYAALVAVMEAAIEVERVQEEYDHGYCNEVALLTARRAYYEILYHAEALMKEGD